MVTASSAKRRTLVACKLPLLRQLSIGDLLRQDPDHPGLAPPRNAAPLQSYRTNLPYSL